MSKDEDHTEWCQHVFRIMQRGGLWGLPRTGLVFRKVGNVLLWVGVIPPKEKWPDLDEAREAEFADNFKHFSKARVAMWRANVIRSFDSMEDAKRHYELEGEMLTDENMREMARRAKR